MTFINIFFSCWFSWPAVCIHGDKSQQERDWVLQGIIFAFPSYTVSVNGMFRFQTSDLVKLLFW